MPTPRPLSHSTAIPTPAPDATLICVRPPAGGALMWFPTVRSLFQVDAAGRLQVGLAFHGETSRQPKTYRDSSGRRVRNEDRRRTRPGTGRRSPSGNSGVSLFAATLWPTAGAPEGISMALCGQAACGRRSP